jgi:hypothetical protein
MPRNLAPSFPVFPTRVTPRSVAAYKSATRVYDTATISLGARSAAEVQEDNSMLPAAVMAKATISFVPAVCADVARLVGRSRVAR